MQQLSIGIPSARDVMITDEELRSAFDKTQLAAYGWTFERALASETLSVALRNIARSLALRPRYKDGT